MNRPGRNTSKNRKIIVVSVLFVLLLWLFDTIIDATFFHHYSFREFLTHLISSNVIFFRVFSLAGFIGFGFLLAWAINKLSHTEKQLAIIQERYKKATTAGKVNVWDWNLENNEFYVDPQLLNQLGYGQHIDVKHIEDWLKFIHSDDVERVMRSIDEYLAGQNAQFEIAHRMIRKSGGIRWVLARGSAVRDKAGNPIRLVGTGTDITEQKLMEAELEKQRDMAQLYLDIAGVILIALDDAGKISLVNQKGCQVLGYQEHELLGQDYFSTCLLPHTQAEVRYIYRQLMAGDIKPAEKHSNAVVTKSGEERIISWRNTILRDQNGAINGIFSSGEDVTELLETEAALIKSETQHRILTELTSDYVYSGLIDAEGQTTTVWIAGAFQKITGYNPQLVTDKTDVWVDFLHPEDQAISATIIQSVINNQPQHFEYRIITKNGEPRWLRDYIKPLWDENEQRVTQFLGAIQDITPGKQAEEQIKASLEEKTVLLREIHHRVKNNLQVVSSLLSLQTDTVTDEPSRQVLQDSQNRIRSMALIHEMLYQSLDFTRINSAHYIPHVVHNLFSVYGGLTNQVALDIAVEELLLNLDSAIPCGLIINELVSNALKHAFPAGDAGYSGNKKAKIRVQLRQTPDNQYELTVNDNGTGLPPDFSWQNSESLGLQLIHILTQQLDGTITVSSKGGTTFQITFSHGL